MDSAAETPDFAMRFRKIFRSCRDFYDRRISEGKQRLSSLNRSLTIADDGSGAVQCLQGIAAETKKEIRSCEDAISRIEAVRQSFFTELKRIGNQAGISMHDPGGIDLSEAGNAVNSGFRWWHQKAAEQVHSTAGRVKPVYTSVLVINGIRMIRMVLGRKIAIEGSMPEAQIVKDQEGTLMIKNLSSAFWSVETPSGNHTIVLPQEIMPVKECHRIKFSENCTAEIRNR